MLSAINHHNHFDKDLIQPGKINKLVVDKRYYDISILSEERYITIQNSKIIQDKLPSYRIESKLFNGLEKIENFYHFTDNKMVEIKVYDAKQRMILFPFVISYNELESYRYKILFLLKGNSEDKVSYQEISNNVYCSYLSIQKTPKNILARNQCLWMEHIYEMDRYRKIINACLIRFIYRNSGNHLRIIDEIYHQKNNLSLHQRKHLLMKIGYIAQKIRDGEAISPYYNIVKYKESFNHDYCLKKNLIEEEYQKLNDDVYKHITHYADNGKDEVIVVEYVSENKKVTIQVNSLNEQSIEIECDDDLLKTSLMNKYLLKKNIKGIYGYKIAETMEDQKCLVTLMILPESKIATDGKKYRTNLATVQNINVIKDGCITDQIIDKAKSCIHCADFYYHKNEKKEVTDFDGTLNEVCKPGIHYFYTITECSEYLGMKIKSDDKKLDDILCDVMVLYNDHESSKPNGKDYYEAKDRFESNDYNQL